MPTILIERTMPAYPGAPVIGTLAGDAPEMYALEDPYILTTVDEAKLREDWTKRGLDIPDFVNWPYTIIKLPGVTAIPAGKYRAVMCLSQRFKTQLPLLIDVPSFTGVRIHIGNTQEDTSGCMLVGKNRQGAKSIGASEIALAELRKWWMAVEPEGPIWVEIVNPAS